MSITNKTIPSLEKMENKYISLLYYPQYDDEQELYEINNKYIHELYNFSKN